MMALRQASTQPRTGWGDDQTQALERGLRELGLDPTPEQQATLRRYGELLLKWNRTYNLLGAATAAAMLEEHLLDSLAVLPVLTAWLPAANPALVDVGTGAGLPGLVLAIMLPRVPIILVEPVGKKAAFLRQVVAECRLTAVTVLEARIEDLAPEQLAPQPQKATTTTTTTTTARATARATPTAATTTIDAPATAPLPHFICRAFTSLDRFAELCTPLLRSGSLMFAMKAAKVSLELQQLRSSIEVLGVEPLRTVEKDVQRNLVVMRSKEPQSASNPTRPTR